MKCPRGLMDWVSPWKVMNISRPNNKISNHNAVLPCILLDKAAEMWFLKQKGDGVHPATAHWLITPNRKVLLGVFLWRV
jgi:hypothetical protein